MLGHHRLAFKVDGLQRRAVTWSQNTQTRLTTLLHMSVPVQTYIHPILDMFHDSTGAAGYSARSPMAQRLQQDSTLPRTRPLLGDSHSSGIFRATMTHACLVSSPMAQPQNRIQRSNTANRQNAASVLPTQRPEALCSDVYAELRRCFPHGTAAKHKLNVDC